MSGHDLLFCEMPLPDTGLGPETLFCTRAFDGVFNDSYRITADGHLFGPVEQVFVYPNRPGEPVHAVAATDCPTEGPPLAWNGDIEFWSGQHSQLVFFACFVDGRCVRMLLESDYRSLMERARRCALHSSSM
jgi:hypothetical protein